MDFISMVTARDTAQLIKRLMTKTIADDDDYKSYNSKINVILTLVARLD